MKKPMPESFFSPNGSINSYLLVKKLGFAIVNADSMECAVLKMEIVIMIKQ